MATTQTNNNNNTHNNRYCGCECQRWNSKPTEDREGLHTCRVVSLRRLRQRSAHLLASSLVGEGGVNPMTRPVHNDVAKSS